MKLINTFYPAAWYEDYTLEFKHKNKGYILGDNIVSSLYLTVYWINRRKQSPEPITNNQEG